MKTLFIRILTLGLVLGACSKARKPKNFQAANGNTVTADGDANQGENNDNPAQGSMLTCSTKDSKSYKGFGNINLVAGRVTDVPKEGDRFRVKPYSVLAGEYTRVLGSVPGSLAANAASFVAAPERWYVEPQASAVTLFTSFRIAYEGTLALVASDTKYSAAPTEESASVICSSFARQVWNRLPTPAEITACKNLAMIETAGETDVKARWAYALASVMASADFLTY